MFLNFRLHNRKLILVVALLGYSITALAGCTCLCNSLKGFLAVSTKEIEHVRDKAIVKIVDYDYKSCYQQVEQRLIEIGSYIYAKRKDLIAVYISLTDTTPAGVFFKEIDKQKTQLEITSPSKDTKEYLAQKIFSAFLEK